MFYLEACSFPSLHVSTSFFDLQPYGLARLYVSEWVILIGLGLKWWIVGFHCPSSRFYPMILFLRASPSHINLFVCLCASLGLRLAYHIRHGLKIEILITNYMALKNNIYDNPIYWYLLILKYHVSLNKPKWLLVWY